jgi:hypothetical protein
VPDEVAGRDGTYAWIDQHPLAMAGCFTLVQGVSEADVIRDFGRHGSRAVHRDVPGPGGPGFDPHGAFDEDDPDQDALDDELSCIWITQVDDWWLVSEDNNYQGTMEETIQNLLAPRHVCVMWNAGVQPQWLSVRDGVVEQATELMRGLGDDELLDHLWAGCSEDDRVSSHQLALIALETETGVRITPAMLAAPQTRVIVIPAWADAEPLLRQPEPDLPDIHDVFAGRVTAEQRRALAEQFSGGTFGSASGGPFTTGSPGFLRVVPLDDQATGAVGPPSGWLPGWPGLPPLDAFGPEVAVRLLATGVLPQGVIFEVQLRGREPYGSWAQLPFGLPRPDAGPGSALEVTMVVADERRCTAKMVGPLPTVSDGPSLAVLASPNTDRVHRYTLWLTPLPPAGPISVEIAWQAQGVPRRWATLDGKALHRAAEHARELWT